MLLLHSTNYLILQIPSLTILRHQINYHGVCVLFIPKLINKPLHTLAHKLLAFYTIFCLFSTILTQFNELIIEITTAGAFFSNLALFWTYLRLQRSLLWHHLPLIAAHIGYYSHIFVSIMLDVALFIIIIDSLPHFLVDAPTILFL